jgi:hypothetical protein
MKEFLKKHRFKIFTAVVLALIVLNVYLYKDSQNLTGIKEQLELENYRLNLDIGKSRVKEERFLDEIAAKNRTIVRLDEKLADAAAERRELKGRLAAMREPADPDSFKKLEECKRNYTLLLKNLDLSLAAVGKAEQTLNLCRAKTQQLNEVITFQELAYLECKEQAKSRETKINRIGAAMERLDRFYKRKLLKKNTIKYTVGIIVGLIAGYFLFKKRN